MSDDTKYYGIYRGSVLSNTDPDKTGRIKVQIYPMFRGITDPLLLPWAVPAYPIYEGSGNGIGYFAVPKVGTLIYCMFEAGDCNQPIYMFEAPSKVHGIPASSATSYPNRKVWKTTNGVEIYVDDQTKTFKASLANGISLTLDQTTNTITLIHSTGSSVIIDPVGQILISSLTNINITGGTVHINPV
jgi:uncharacterized protein involved in type VI secretion and phage assembly